MTNDKKAVDLNLDAYKASADLEPFTVVLGGKPYQFTHIDELPAWDVMDGFVAGEAAATTKILQLALGDKYTEFRKHPLKNGAPPNGGRGCSVRPTKTPTSRSRCALK